MDNKTKKAAEEVANKKATSATPETAPIETDLGKPSEADLAATDPVPTMSTASVSQVNLSNSQPKINWWQKLGLPAMLGVLLGTLALGLVLGLGLGRVFAGDRDHGRNGHSFNHDRDGFGRHGGQNFPGQQGDIHPPMMPPNGGTVIVPQPQQQAPNNDNQKQTQPKTSEQQQKKAQ